MTAELLIETLKRSGARMTVNGDRLKIDAPQGLLTPELKEELVARKSELIHLLTSSTPGIRDGALVIPLDTSPKYRWWQGGQPIVETLADLSAPPEIWRQYAAFNEDLISEDHSRHCQGKVKTVGQIIYCLECRYFGLITEDIQ